MTEFLRSDDSHFDALDDWPYEPQYHQWKDLRVHYVDVGPADGPVMLLMHGMPTWAYLYRTMIPQLVEAGYRCIAPDHLGFGRSDKHHPSYEYSEGIRHVRTAGTPHRSEGFRTPRSMVRGGSRCRFLTTTSTAETAPRRRCTTPTIDVIPDAGHFLQHTHGPEVVEHILRRIAAE